MKKIHGVVYWKQEETNDNNYQNRGREERDIPNLQKLRRSVEKITITYNLTTKQREELQE